MRLILILESVISRVRCWYYKLLFQAWTGCREPSLTVLGKVVFRIPKYRKGQEKLVKIGKNVTIYENVCLWGDGTISIGNHSTLFRDVTVYASRDAGVTIGDHVMVAGFGYITDANHGMKLSDLPMTEQSSESRPITIEDDVWLGQGVTVLAGSHIRRGAVVGAQSLVNGEISENTIAVGTPARAVKFRSR